MRKIFFIFIFFCTYSTYAQINCNDWLSTPSEPSYVDIGQLNVTGNQITVEAVINRTTPYTQGIGDGNEGDIVSKHDNPTDVNYLLRPNHCYITTQNGFFGTPDVAEIELNKTYHVAMVYDGSTLKYYRNGCLMSEIAATGNLFQNSWDTRIGFLQSQNYNTNFIGYINEVRIWNVARTQDEIRTYMNISLPNPTTQPGLLAYYTFNNLINKQGNPSWNGTLGGSASINNTNPKCNAIDNVCNVNCSSWLSTPSVPSNVEVGQLNIPGNQVTVEALINRTTPYTGGQVWAGDVVSKHRDPTDVNYLLRPNSGEITTNNGYFKTPDIADINLNQTYHIAMVYDGTTLKFYRNGCLMSQIAATGNLVQNSWITSIGYYSPELFPNENFIGYINEVRIWNVARTQSEIRANMNSSLPNPTTQPGLLAYYTFDNLINKQGNPAWNGTLGGTASINQTNPSCNAIPGSMISASADTTICFNTSVKIFAAGGSSYLWSPTSTLNDPTSATPIATPLSSTVYYVQVTDSNSCTIGDSVKITVTPAPVITISGDTTLCATAPVQLSVSGGSNYIWTPASTLNNTTSATPIASPLSSTLYHVKITDANSCIYNDSVNIAISPKPVIKISSDTAICINNSVQIFVSGGNSYVWSPASTLDNPESATPVASPLSTTLYHVQIKDTSSCTYNDSVKVSVNPANAIITKSNDTAICHNTSAQIFASGGNTYIWSPASTLNNSTSSTPIASPLSTTEYYVKITDVNTCIYNDSVKISIKPTLVITKSDDTTICNKASVQLFVSGGNNYVWSPASSLNIATTSNPVASPISTTVYQVSITDANSCVNLDSIKVTVRPPVVFSVSPDNSVCTNNSQQLSASGGDTYTWSPANSLDNPNSSDPIATPNQTTTYSVTIKENTCDNSATLTTILTVLPPPNIQAASSNDITCKQPSSQLSALGAQDYSWSPATGLDNSAIANPLASPNISTVYTVVGKDANGCVNSDTVSVNVDYNKDTFYGLPNSFTPNNDGLNDCFGIKYWGQVDQLEFSVYNRWGQRVFYTTNSSVCWDGTFNGKMQNPGAFVYVVKAKTACGNIDRKGVVILIR